jgi:hypothetical protein
LAAALALCIAPWTWRNYKVTGLFIPVVGNSGLAYFTGNAHWGITLPACAPEEHIYHAVLRHAGLATDDPKKDIRYFGFTNAKLEKLANDRMKEHIRAHPAAFAKKVVLNALEYYAPIIFYIVPPQGAVRAGTSFAQRLRIPGVKGFLALTLFLLTLVMVSLAGFYRLWRSPETKFISILLLLAWAAFAVPYFPFLTFFAGRSLYYFGTFPVLSILMASLLTVKPFHSDEVSRAATK